MLPGHVTALVLGEHHEQEDCVVSPSPVVDDANAAAFSAAGGTLPNLPQTAGSRNQHTSFRVRGEAQLQKTIAFRIEQALDPLGEDRRLLDQHPILYANGVHEASSLSET